MVDFVLLTICHREVTGQTAWSVEKAHSKGTMNFLWVISPGDALVGRARSINASYFLESEMAPFLIFLDSDIVFEPEELERLYSDLKAGYDFIGGVYPVRGESQLAHYGLGDGVTIDGKIIEVQFLSCGFTGISKRLLERLVKELPLPILNEHDWARCYPFFETGRYIEEPYQIYISEDWDFCNKVRAIGAKPFLDTSILLGHIGKKIYTPHDVVNYQKQKAAAEATPSVCEPCLKEDNK